MSLRIGDISVSPGMKRSVKLKVAKLINGNMLEVPVYVVNGVKKGPKLVLSAPAWREWDWARRVMVETDPKDLAGGLICINFDDPLSVGLGGAGYNTYVGEMWRGRRWPGDRDGTISERMAYVITEEVIKKADCLISLVAGPRYLLYSPIMMEIDVGLGGDLRKRIDEVADVYGLEVICAHVVMDSIASVSARTLGIPALQAEYWWPGLESVIETHVTGIRNVMSFLGMIEGEIVDRTTKKAYIKETTKWFPVTRANVGGYFYPEVGREVLGGVVRKGQFLGRTLSPSTFEEAERVVAPWDGVCCVARHRSPLQPGDSVYWIAKMEKVTWLKKPEET